MTVVNDCAGSSTTETENVISQLIYDNGQLLQRQDKRWVIIFFYVFGEFDHFEDWDAAQENERLTTRRELVHSAGKKKPHDFNSLTLLY